MNLILGFNVIKHLIQNPVVTKDHTGLMNIFASLDILKIESVLDIIKNWDGEFHGSVYNSTLTLLSKNRLQMLNGKWMVIVKWWLWNGNCFNPI